MGILQGKGIWTLYSDIDLAISHAPQVGARYILCKVSRHGSYSLEDANSALAKIRQNPDLTAVAWTYSYLKSVEAEAECLQRALNDGFKAIVIDAEADLNGKFDAAEALVQRVLATGLDTSRIYLCSDPRLDTKLDEIPTVPLAKICRGGFLPMIYGEILPSDRKEAAAKIMQSAYDQYERNKARLGYTLPLMPVISTYWDNQGHARMTRAEFKRWCDEAQNRNATFVSLYRAGVTAEDAWRPFGKLVVSGVELRDGKVVIQPGGPGFSEGAYPPAQPGTGWSEFVDASGHLTLYRTTLPDHTMWATYLPALPEAGRYVIEVFVPRVHATTRGAQYFIVAYQDSQKQETRVTVDQRIYSDVWVPLGTFDLDPQYTEAGRVNLVDQTSDTAPKEIAFSAIRWRRVVMGAPGFDSPVGTAEERAGTKTWPGRWVDSNPYGTKYGIGYHTGADLNLNLPGLWNADKGKPVYAVADGVVTCAREVGGAWQGLVVINHGPLPGGTPVYARYGHVDGILVDVGESVTRGQQIAQVGENGASKPEDRNYHLHFDVSTTEVLANDPTHWPGFNLDEVHRHYVDPHRFIEDHRP